MEGTSLNLNYGFNRMKDLGLEPREIRATGGGAKSQSWLQIISTVFETPVITLAEPESAAFGAALQAIWCYYGENGQEVEIKELASRLVKAGHLAAQPDPDQFQLYRELYQRHNSLWKRLSPEFSLHRQWLNSTLSGAPDKNIDCKEQPARQLAVPGHDNSLVFKRFNTADIFALIYRILLVPLEVD